MPDSTATARRPSFIIGGAAKSGTTTLHHLLDQLPGVFIPRDELYVFAIDDIEQHPDFFVAPDGTWLHRDFDANRAEYLDWYASWYRSAPAGALLGEDSTSYLASARAARRIRHELPDVKLIFLLRDPSQRTYSQYWHDLRVGRVVEDFEATLRHAPGTLIQRSLYREQVARYLDCFPARQLKFLLFEHLVADPLAVLREVLDFLEVEASGDLRATDHRNPARVPRSLALQLWRNRLFRDRVASRFRGHLPGTIAPTGTGERLVRGRWARLMFRHDRRPPPMQPVTHRFLDHLFMHENDGLGELIGRDVNSAWYRGI
ncbi:MAG: sulfotransferase [Chloroflexota bacterium]|nr:sulfotransferase [Chloroflexota bacterium]